MRLDFSSSMIMAWDGAAVDGGVVACWASTSGKITGSSHIELMVRKPTSFFNMLRISCLSGTDEVTLDWGQVLTGKI
jgi:hypothetical protein